MVSGPIEINKITDYWSYLASIDWLDPWLICLVLSHIIITVAAILTRRHSNIQMFLFLSLLLMVYFSETINEIAAKNWKIFSREQYFDSNGLFISTVFSIPILLNCMLMIGTWLYNSTLVMQKLKVAQLRDKLKQSKMSAENSNTGIDKTIKPKVKLS